MHTFYTIEKRFTATIFFGRRRKMRKIFWFWCIWSSISIFTQTDIFPPIEYSKNPPNSRLQQIVDLYIEHILEQETE